MNILKLFRPEVCVIFVFIAFFCFVFDRFIFSEYRTTKRINKIVNKLVIEGNKVAISIKKDGFLSYRIRAEDEVLILEALKGNESAIKALKIKIE